MGFITIKPPCELGNVFCFFQPPAANPSWSLALLEEPETLGAKKHLKNTHFHEVCVCKLLSVYMLPRGAKARKNPAASIHPPQLQLPRLRKHRSAHGFWRYLFGPQKPYHPNTGTNSGGICPRKT